MSRWSTSGRREAAHRWPSGVPVPGGQAEDGELAEGQTDWAEVVPKERGERYRKGVVNNARCCSRVPEGIAFRIVGGISWVGAN